MFLLALIRNWLHQLILLRGTVIGAGSTITKDTPENELTLSRSKQVTIKGWQRPQKAKKNKKENS